MKRGNRLLFLMVVLFATDCLAQSVADVARKERERQKSANSRVTATNYGKNGTPAAAPAPAPGTTTTAAAKPSGPADNNGRDEKYWRTAFQTARDNAKRAEARVELLDLKIKQLNTDMLQYSSFYNREYRLGPEIAAAQKELEDARKESELAKKKIFDLEEELRKSGGPAGWAR
jgi:hypothetical protein